MGSKLTVMRLFFSLVHPLLRASGKDKTMKRIPKTPTEFDYDLWTTEDGKCMVRVKRTGEQCEVSRETFRILRAEEKKLRRSMTGVPVCGSDDEEVRMSILSLDYVSIDGGDELSPAWLEDPERTEDIIMTKILEEEFVNSLTPSQHDVYLNCLCGGMSLLAYAKHNNLAFSTVKDTRDAIRKKFKKVFEGTR